MRYIWVYAQKLNWTCSKVIIYFESDPNERVLCSPVNRHSVSIWYDCGLFTASFDFDLYQFIAHNFFSFLLNVCFFVFGSIVYCVCMYILSNLEHIFCILPQKPFNVYQWIGYSVKFCCVIGPLRLYNVSVSAFIPVDTWANSFSAVHSFSHKS